MLALPWQSRFSRGLKLVSFTLPETPRRPNLPLSFACSPG